MILLKITKEHLRTDNIVKRWQFKMMNFLMTSHCMSLLIYILVPTNNIVLGHFEITEAGRDYMGVCNRVCIDLSIKLCMA